MGFPLNVWPAIPDLRWDGTPALHSSSTIASCPLCTAFEIVQPNVDSEKKHPVTGPRIELSCWPDVYFRTRLRCRGPFLRKPPLRVTSADIETGGYQHHIYPQSSHRFYLFPIHRVGCWLTKTQSDQGMPRGPKQETFAVVSSACSMNPESP